jgi:hypothetical protein
MSLTVQSPVESWPQGANERRKTYPSPIFFVPEIGPNDDALLGFPTF